MYFYNYSGGVDTINKTSKLTNGYYVDEKTLTNYSLSTNGGTVLLPYSLFETITDGASVDGVNYNYCTYFYGTLDSVQVGAFVSLTHGANGMCVANITVDPLYTCWLNGCMNVQGFVEYGAENIYSIDDTRLAVDGVLHREYFNMSSLSDYLFIISCTTPPPNTTGSPNIPTNPSNNTVYALTSDAFYKFMDNLRSIGDSTQDRELNLNLFAPSINGIFTLPCANSYSLMEKFSQIGLPDRDTIRLWATSTGEAVVEPAVDWYKDISVMPSVSPTSHYAIKLSENIGSNNIYVDLGAIPVNFDIISSGALRHGVIIIDIPFVGLINIDIKNLNLREIESINIRFSYDFTSGAIRATPIINNTVYIDYSLVSSITEIGGVMQGNAITNVSKMAQSVWSNTVGAAGRIVDSVISGGLFSAITQAPAESIKFATPTSTPVLGSKYGGNIDRGYIRPIQVIIEYSKYIRYEQFVSLYGYPFMGVTNISLMATAPYIKTRNVHLLSNNLDSDIINAAETLLNNGCHFT